jgi:hypothetical protein
MSIGLLGFVRAHKLAASLNVVFWVVVFGRAQREMGCINSSSLCSFIELLIHPISLCLLLALLFCFDLCS